MTGSQRQIQLAAYADNELPAPQRASVERWLAESPEARSAVESQQQLRQVVNCVIQDTPVPADLAESVLGALRSDRRSTRTRRLRLFSAGAFAAAAAIVLMWTVAGPSLWNREWIEAPPIAAHSLDVRELANRADAALANPLDEFRVSGKSVASATALLKKLQVFPRQEQELPDLSAHGYSLAGVGRIQVTPNVSGLQVTYTNTETDDSLLLLLLDKRVTLQFGSARTGEIEKGGSRYQFAELRDHLSFVTRSESFSSFVLCGRHSPEALLQISNAIRLALAPPSRLHLCV